MKAKLLVGCVALGLTTNWPLIADGPKGECLGYHVPSGDPHATAAIAEIDETHGAHLRSDGKGPYIDGNSDVRTYASGALMILVRWSNSCDYIPPYTRKVAFDFSKPIGDAKSKGVVVDHDSWISCGPERGVLSKSMPVGKPQRSDVTEFSIYIDEVLHVLHFGPGVYPDKRNVNGNGTTQPTVTRTSETTWTVEAPAGSIGRLWKQPTSKSPIDLGLYNFTFKITYTAK